MIERYFHVGAEAKRYISHHFIKLQINTREHPVLPITKAPQSTAAPPSPVPVEISKTHASEQRRADGPIGKLLGQAGGKIHTQD